jgi:molybdate transport system substrate-binding protein
VKNNSLYRHERYFLFFLLWLFIPVLQAEQMTIATANSTCTIIKEVGALFEKQSSVSIDYICKSSGRLAKGIKGKVIKADFYISANKEWMTWMIENALVSEQAVKSLWGNSLVVAVPRQDPIIFNKWEDLTSFKVKTVMIGDPGTAPFGRYAKQSLTSTGLWDTVKQKIQTKKHITLLADSLAESEYGTAGILFKTNVNEQMRIVFHIDNSTHKPIRYYSAPLKNADNPVNAIEFFKFLATDQVQEHFAKAGFQLFNSKNE